MPQDILHLCYPIPSHSFALLECSRSRYYNLSMEEYRRKYLSPSHSRVSCTLDTLQKDQSVSDLRKELLECKEMEEKFDDLSHEMVKLERENKAISGEQALVEADYLQNIKKNKNRITTLKQQVLDHREDIELQTTAAEQGELENEQLTLELERINREQQNNTEECQKVEHEILAKEMLKTQLRQKIRTLEVQTASLNGKCQEQSEILKQEYTLLQKSEAKLRQQELTNGKRRKELESLTKERQLRQKKVRVSENEAICTKAELELNQMELAKQEALCESMRQKCEVKTADAEKTKAEIKRLALKNKAAVLRIMDTQEVLFSSNKNLQKDQAYLEKMNVKEAELRKGNEHLEDVLKKLEQALQEEQESYNRTIGHMRYSIQQDERAIEGLVKQANFIENIVS